jgi:hypothetical protein
LPARLWMRESKLRLACKCNYSMKLMFFMISRFWTCCVFS